MSSFLQSTKDLIVGHRKSDPSHHGSKKPSSHLPGQGFDGEALPIAQTTPAWHVHGSSSVKDDSNPTTTSKSTKVGRSMGDSLLHPGVAPRTQESQALSAAAVPQLIPDRDSSLRAKARDEGHRRKKSEPHSGLDHIDSETAQVKSLEEMDRSTNPAGSHLSRKPVPTLAEQDVLSDQIRKLSLQYEHDHQDQFGETVDKSGKPLIGQPSNIQSPGQNNSSVVERKPLSPDAKHLALPDGFHMQNSRHTVVDTEIRPAVTHEVIHRHVKEIKQEIITRDIHVHHYYTYTQPIKVVEVLPAKHYMLDVATGKKTAIPAPLGWQMPPNLQPHTPDLSAIKGSSRHYLVNEEHPNGIPEAAPAGFNGSAVEPSLSAPALPPVAR